MSNVCGEPAIPCAEETRGLGCGDGLIERDLRMRVFRAQVDVTLRGSDRDAGNRHALDEHERIAFHDHAVGERAAVALVRVADDVLLLAHRRVVDRLPLDAGREACAAAAAQAGLRDFLDDLDGLDGERPLEPLVAAVRLVVGERDRIGETAAREGEARLLLEEGDVFRRAEGERMLDFRSGRLGQRRNDLARIGFRHRTEGVAHAVVLDLEQRLEPEHAARAVADDLGFSFRFLRGGGDRLATSSAPQATAAASRGTKIRIVMRRPPRGSCRAWLRRGGRRSCRRPSPTARSRRGRGSRSSRA